MANTYNLNWRAVKKWMNERTNEWMIEWVNDLTLNKLNEILQNGHTEFIFIQLYSLLLIVRNILFLSIFEPNCYLCMRVHWSIKLLIYESIDRLIDWCVTAHKRSCSQFSLVCQRGKPALAVDEGRRSSESCWCWLLVMLHV